MMNEKKEAADRDSNGSRNKLNRISNSQQVELGRILVDAEKSVAAEERTQRSVIRDLIPHIYVLRKMKGYTFKQISEILNQGGCSLTAGSLGKYYSLMYPRRIDDCNAALEAAYQRAKERNDGNAKS